MTKIAVLTDSSTYLPSRLVEEHAIHVIPLVLLWGDQALRDGLEITPAQFYRRLEEDQNLPTTTQPTPEDFLRVYNHLAESHDAIVAVLISSELSGTVSSAQVAASSFDRIPVRVVDSRLTYMGLGFAVLTAARAALKDRDLDEVEHAAMSAASRSRVMFVVDTLEYLHRGGRIGGASRLLGTALSIKPLLHLKDGRVDALERVRTKGKAISRMLDLATEYVAGRPVRAAVVHANACSEAESLQTQIADRFECLELFVTELSPVIATHTGPGTLGVGVCPET